MDTCLTTTPLRTRLLSFPPPLQFPLGVQALAAGGAPAPAADARADAHAQAPAMASAAQAAAPAGPAPAPAGCAAFIPGHSAVLPTAEALAAAPDLRGYSRAPAQFPQRTEETLAALRAKALSHRDLRGLPSGAPSVHCLDYLNKVCKLALVLTLRRDREYRGAMGMPIGQVAGDLEAYYDIVGRPMDLGLIKGARRRRCAPLPRPPPAATRRASSPPIAALCRQI